MGVADSIREEIEQRILKASRLIPPSRPDDLPTTDTFPDVPEWHHHEHALWAMGEQVRCLLNKRPLLRADEGIYRSILEIVSNRAGMRGRQSWILLFAYRPCAKWAGEIAALIPDSDIDGHVISALYKMKAFGFAAKVSEHAASKITWIRKGATRYLQWEKGTEQVVPPNGCGGVLSP